MKFLNNWKLGKKNTKDSKQTNKEKNNIKTKNKKNSINFNQQTQQITNNFNNFYTNSEQKINVEEVEEETSRKNFQPIKTLENLNLKKSNEEKSFDKISNINNDEYKSIIKAFKKHNVEKKDNYEKINLGNSSIIIYSNATNQSKTIEFVGQDYYSINDSKDLIIELLKRTEAFFVSEKTSTKSNELFTILKSKLFSEKERLYLKRWEKVSQIDEEVKKNIYDCDLAIIELSCDVSIIQAIGIFFLLFKSYKKIIFLINKNKINHIKNCKSVCCIIKQIKNYFGARTDIDFVEYNSQKIYDKIPEIIHRAKKIVKFKV